MRLAVALVTVYLVWGSTYLAIAVANRTLPPFLMLSVRFLIAGALLYGWTAWRGELAAARPGRREWGAAATVGGLLLVVDTGGVAWAELRVPSGMAALLVATVPVFIAVLDRVFFGVRLGFGAVAGISIGLVGVALLVGPSGSLDAAGAAVILVASLAWAAGSVYARVAPLPRAPLVSASLQMLCAGGLLAVAGIATGELSRVHPGRISAASLGAVAFLIVFGSLLAFTAYAWLLKNAPSSLLSTYAYVNPAVAVFLGWALVGERVGGKELAAGLVILSSVALLVFGRGPRAAAEPIAESLAPYIRRKDAQILEFPRPVPRLSELPRIAV
ncbi:MAG TPA: EamA family transporter [Gaiellaceae bacterium]|nr:EamA family transporter [Gaiellaceae bacterium]